VSAALAHRWEPLFRGGAPPQRLTMGAVQESQTTSHCAALKLWSKIGIG
jgi:hypothetical protein